jgi:gluconate kinase
LKLKYRDCFRELEAVEGIKVIFFGLQVDRKELVRRTIRGGGSHYMKNTMTESHSATGGRSSPWETDLLPVDAGKSVEEVIEEVVALLAIAKDIL